MIELLMTLQEECDQRLKEETLPRRINLPDLPSKIHVLTGMRRTGKTTFLFQLMNRLEASGVPRENILLVNFEDDRLHPLRRESLAAVVDTWYSMLPTRHDTLCHLVFDEVHCVPEWESTVRRFHDTKKARIYLAGSSARLLSREIATALRGRAFTTEVWPFDFEECPGNAGFSPEMGQRAKDRFMGAFSLYMARGGFPETFGVNRSVAVRILQDYVEVVLVRDLLERWNLSNLTLLKELVHRLITQPGRSFSINRYYNELKSRGFTLGKSNLYEYSALVEDAYLAFSVPLHSASIKKVQVNPRKIYAIDTGLVNSATLTPERDRGHLFENIVFLALRRRGWKVWYYLTRERFEVDFLAEHPTGGRLLIQACWDEADPATLERERRALESACRETGLPGTLVTPGDYLRFCRTLEGY